MKKQTLRLLEQSIDLDRNAKPGDIYLDPVWGIVQVPYHNLDLGAGAAQPGDDKPQAEREEQK